MEDLGGGRGGGVCAFILHHSRQLPTGVIARPPILLLRGGHMVFVGSDVGNVNDDGPGLGDNRRRGGGRGRTGKDSDVEYIDIEADREQLALPSYPPLKGDRVGVGVGVGVGDEDNR